ncbi:hypothetical protein DM01DRAFT_1312630 [Hesseltinella vesiculosa]|uniref:Uncharacterized protein n=1 Tax=Hesseltinella vesiculosa TaxID=101127 RepID=A0A1X2G3U7_9FUNG|nr:hypothetical protein DM01DRAFT_1312630 [Hesseltinella vesiculosa]
MRDMRSLSMDAGTLSKTFSTLNTSSPPGSHHSTPHYYQQQSYIYGASSASHVGMHPSPPPPHPTGNRPFLTTSHYRPPSMALANTPAGPAHPAAAAAVAAMNHTPSLVNNSHVPTSTPASTNVASPLNPAGSHMLGSAPSNLRHSSYMTSYEMYLGHVQPNPPPHPSGFAYSPAPPTGQFKQGYIYDTSNPYMNYLEKQPVHTSSADQVLSVTNSNDTTPTTPSSSSHAEADHPSFHTPQPQSRRLSSPVFYPDSATKLETIDKEDIKAPGFDWDHVL